MSNKNKGGQPKSAQELEAKHQEFLKKLDARLENENFSEEVKTEIREIAKSSSPGDKEAINKIANLFKENKSNTSENRTEKPNESENESTDTEFSKISNSDDFEKFVVFAKATQIIPIDSNVDDFSENEQSELVQQFNHWKKKGKPSAINPLANDEPEKILRVTRIKAYGRQFITAIIKGQDVPLGVELVPVYRKYTDNGKVTEDRTKVIATNRKYNLPYTDKLAKELLKRCEKEAESMQMTFKEGGGTIYISDPKNFTRNFDDVIKEARSGQPV